MALHGKYQQSTISGMKTTSHTIRKRANEWLESLRRGGDLSERTLSAREIDARKFCDWCEQNELKKFNDITAKIAMRYLESMAAKGRRPWTIARRLNSISQWFDWLVESGATACNPCQGHSKIVHAVAVVPRVPLNSSVCESMTGSDELTIRNRALIATIADAGLSIAEAMSMTRGDVKTRGGMLSLRSKGRWRCLKEPTAESLARYLKVRKRLADVGRESLWISVSTAYAGKPMSARSIYRAIRAAR